VAPPSNELPEILTPLFWDTDASAIDPIRHRDFILGRILSVGTRDALR
jgi:hypothetical protein